MKLGHAFGHEAGHITSPWGGKRYDTLSTQCTVIVTGTVPNSFSRVQVPLRVRRAPGSWLQPDFAKAEAAICNRQGYRIMYTTLPTLLPR